jgi:hypothetical protein
MKKKSKIFGATLICVVLLGAIYFIFVKTSSPDEEVIKFAEEMNSRCPVMVDLEIRLDEVKVLADQTLLFNHTFIYNVKDSLRVNDLKRFFEPMILNNIKKSPILNKYLDKNLTWIYSYNDKLGNFLFKLTYTPDRFK